MKKISALMLAALLLLSMAACGQSQPSQTAAPETQATVEPTEETTVP